jgi:hypothetical protein
VGDYIRPAAFRPIWMASEKQILLQKVIVQFPRASPSPSSVHLGTTGAGAVAASSPPPTILTSSSSSAVSYSLADGIQVTVPAAPPVASPSPGGADTAIPKKAPADTRVVRGTREVKLTDDGGALTALGMKRDPRSQRPYIVPESYHGMDAKRREMMDTLIDIDHMQNIGSYDHRGFVRVMLLFSGGGVELARCRYATLYRLAPYRSRLHTGSKCTFYCFPLVHNEKEAGGGGLRCELDGPLPKEIKESDREAWTITGGSPSMLVVAQHPLGRIVDIMEDTDIDLLSHRLNAVQLHGDAPSSALTSSKTFSGGDAVAPVPKGPVIPRAECLAAARETTTVTVHGLDLPRTPHPPYFTPASHLVVADRNLGEILAEDRIRYHARKMVKVLLTTCQDASDPKRGYTGVVEARCLVSHIMSVRNAARDVNGDVAAESAMQMPLYADDMHHIYLVPIPPVRHLHEKDKADTKTDRLFTAVTSGPASTALTPDPNDTDRVDISEQYESMDLSILVATDLPPLCRVTDFPPHLRDRILEDMPGVLSGKAADPAPPASLLPPPLPPPPPPPPSETMKRVRRVHGDVTRRMHAATMRASRSGATHGSKSKTEAKGEERHKRAEERKRKMDEARARRKEEPVLLAADDPTAKMRRDRQREEETRRRAYEEAIGALFQGYCGRAQCPRIGRRVTDADVFFRITCDLGCSTVYHKGCFSAVTRHYQKEELGSGAACVTADCDGGLVSICAFDKDNTVFSLSLFSLVTIMLPNKCVAEGKGTVVASTPTECGTVLSGIVFVTTATSTPRDAAAPTRSAHDPKTRR